MVLLLGTTGSFKLKQSVLMAGATLMFHMFRDRDYTDSAEVDANKTSGLPA